MPVTIYQLTKPNMSGKSRSSKWLCPSGSNEYKFHSFIRGQEKKSNASFSTWSMDEVKQKLTTGLFLQ